MVAYSFQKRFAPRILSGVKDQTIRTQRTNGHAAPGNALQLYTGMRTRQCRLILRTTCSELLRVRLVFRPIVEIEVDLEKLAPADLDAFARRDGFDDLADMAEFWRETHSAREFEGFVIRWPAYQGEAV